MDYPARRSFPDEASWTEALLACPKVPAVVRALAASSEPLQESVSNAAHFVGGAAMRDEFRLFKNGGIPLLERRSGDWIQEIVFRIGPAGVRGIYAPVGLRIHLSHRGLKAVRSKYWRAASAAPASVATADIGALELLPCRLLWNVCRSPEAAEDMARTILGLAVPWFDCFLRPRELWAALVDGAIPLVDRETALELCLTEFGEDGAKRYLSSLARADEEVGRKIARRVDQITHAVVPGLRGTSPIHNLAVIAASYGLVG